MTNKNISQQQDLGQGINIRQEIEKYLRYWKWFFLGIFLSLLVSWLYLRYTASSYQANASIMIKDNKKSGISAELAAFEDLGILGGSANNTDNEIEILKSRKIIGRVVDSLQLNINYLVSGRVIESQIYKENNPIVFKRKQFPAKKEVDTSFIVVPKDALNFNLLDADKKFISSHSYGEIIFSQIGTFTIEKNEYYIGKNAAQEIKIALIPKYKVIDLYRKKINISPVNKNSSVLNLSLSDVVPEKAEDILDELIKQYNIDAIQDKREVSQKTKEFIDERLQKVKSDLYIIDKDVEKFKFDQDFSGLPFEAQLAFESLKETTTKITELKVSLAWAKEIQRSLTKDSDTYETLPAALGFTEDQAVSSSINEYNTLVLQINRTKEIAGPKNPVLRGLDKQKNNLRSSLLGSLSNITNSLELQLQELYKEEQKVLSKVKSLPANEQGFIDIARQQEIIGSLYQYLLKKKEETDISLAVTVPNAKIIDVAYSSKLPVAPKKKIIYFAALLLGLLIPFVILYLLDLLDTKVHNKKDIEAELSVPFLGDVPKSESKEKVIIGNNVRSSTAEALRLIRTNLDFMLTSNRKQSKSIFITSTTSGEGKSFISINLAATLALSGKKVLLMGMDLRAPKVTEYLGIPERKGVTNYITDEEMLLKDIIFQIPEIKGLDIVASGVIPPNPAELLMTKRVENLFTIVKQEYDFVLVDTAPVNLVTDTLLVSKHADMVMYVVRANYLDKRLLAVPQELYNDKKLPNMAIVLNDTDPKRSYGYGYGGYGYGYVVVEKPWYKKIFDKKN